MRKGSLVLNPGGPGGSGVDFALGVGPFIGQLYGEDVRRSFDIVGVDPRGIGRSTPLRCFGNLQQAAAAFPPVPFPMTSGEEAAVVRADGVLAGQCDRQGNVVGRHMSTAGVARDLDVLRQRLGEQRLNFLGLSYGSYLGTTYANLFPDRVGSVVVDAVLDPVAWRNRGGQAPSTSLLGSHLGAQATLEKFFELCDSAGSGCALAPASADRFARLAARLEAAPGLFVDPVTGEQFLSATRTSSLSRSAACTTSSPSLDLAQVLALLEGSASPEAVGAAFARLDAANGLVTKRGLPRYLNVLEGFPGVLCSDSENPRSYAAWSAAGVQADQDSYFGRLWTWASSPCAQWPMTDLGRYDGPYTARTASPVLVVGNRYDPATPYAGAQAVRRLLPNSSLLTVDVAGHTSLGANACAGAVIGQYLLDPASVAPAVDGMTCPAEFNPFELSASTSAPAAQGLQPKLRMQVLPQVALRPAR
jgi:pimeloyl-ACP methyl ester carboxylesterase